MLPFSSFQMFEFDQTLHSVGRWNVVNGKPGSFGPWRLSSEHVSSAQTEAKKQWQQLEARSNAALSNPCGKLAP